jgi:Ca2+-binding RTX toxin-like protein
MQGDGGADTLVGGDGRDTLLGGAGEDSAAGGAGDDALGGGAGADLLHGEDGADAISGGAGADRLCGDEGDDTLAGDGDEDSLWGGDGDDLLQGGLGDDVLVDTFGADTLAGGEGDDVLLGRSDAGEPDIALPDPKKSVLVDGVLVQPKVFGDAPMPPSDDVLTGGAGADTFRFETFINARSGIARQFADADGVVDWMAVAMQANQAHYHWVDGFGDDVITDFDRAEGDRIELAGHTILVKRIEYRGADSVVHLWPSTTAAGRRTTRTCSAPSPSPGCASPRPTCSSTARPSTAPTPRSPRGPSWPTTAASSPAAGTTP